MLIHAFCQLSWNKHAPVDASHDRWEACKVLDRNLMASSTRKNEPVGCCYQTVCSCAIVIVSAIYGLQANMCILYIAQLVSDDAASAKAAWAAKAT
jgi:hypothetical protein